ncbi:MAG: hypothetical protein M8350_08230, partial [Methanosarcinaceae archaeon]|nr:hypothetical protein [Methanosarcinaceae archaeon]
LSEEELKKVRDIIDKSIKIDEGNDCFICPNGDVLVRRGEYEYNGKVQYHYYGAKCGYFVLN